MTELAGLELRDRAFRFVSERGSASEDDVLAHVYGGAMPAALRARLAGPLLADPRLERQPNGAWSVRIETPASGFTALVSVASGPSPRQARLVGLVALHVEAGEVAERFEVTLNPGVRVPRYALDRLGIDLEALEGLPLSGDVVDDLVRFLGNRLVLAQDVALSWEFVTAEARRHGRVLVQPNLVDFNSLAHARLQLKGKPSLSVVAAQLGLGSHHVTRASEEARLLASIGTRLLAGGAPDPEPAPATTLRRGATARALPDQPGVYVLRDRDQTPLYVGKARRLRARMKAYVHRPVGTTRRLEGLVGRVQAVDATECQTDLEALILEDREIRRLQPRFNTVRQQRMPRLWICWPLQRTSARSRPLALTRLELSTGPGTVEGPARSRFVGPFRNESLADQARQLARDVFDLDRLRSDEPRRYALEAAEAWRFLEGESERAEARARATDVRLLRKVLAFDVRALLLPADPLHARYAVVRPAAVGGVEGFLVDHASLRAWTTLEDGDVFAFARRLVEGGEPRTTPEDTRVVLRWLGAQRPPARLIYLTDDPLAAADAIEQAVLDQVAEA